MKQKACFFAWAEAIPNRQGASKRFGNDSASWVLHWRAPDRAITSGRLLAEARNPNDRWSQSFPAGAQKIMVAPQLWLAGRPTVSLVRLLVLRGDALRQQGLTRWSLVICCRASHTGWPLGGRQGWLFWWIRRSERNPTYADSIFTASPVTGIAHSQTPHIPSHSLLNRSGWPASASVRRSTSSSGTRERCTNHASFCFGIDRMAASTATASAKDSGSSFFSERH